MNDWFDEIDLISTPWMQSKWMKRYLYGSIGVPAEAITQMFLIAANIGLLDNPDIPFDALNMIGIERNLPRYNDYSIDGYTTTDGYQYSLETETDADYAIKLKEAWDIWDLAGTKTGLETALTKLCNLSSFEINETSYAHFNVVINQPNSFVITRWGDGYWGSSFWGGEEIHYVYKTINQFKPVFAKCDYVRVYTDQVPEGYVDL